MAFTLSTIHLPLYDLSKIVRSFKRYPIYRIIQVYVM